MKTVLWVLCCESGNFMWTKHWCWDSIRTKESVGCSYNLGLSLPNNFPYPVLWEGCVPCLWSLLDISIFKFVSWAILMSIHNVCFDGEIKKKKFSGYPHTEIWNTCNCMHVHANLNPNCATIPRLQYIWRSSCFIMQASFRWNRQKILWEMRCFMGQL